MYQQIECKEREKGICLILLVVATEKQFCGRVARELYHKESICVSE